MHGFVDVYWVGDLDHIRSKSVFVFNIFGGAINWMNTMQAIVALQLQNMSTLWPLMEVMKPYGCEYCVNVITLFIK
jgi:hypothetical protein